MKLRTILDIWDIFNNNYVLIVIWSILLYLSWNNRFLSAWALIAIGFRLGLSVKNET